MKTQICTVGDVGDGFRSLPIPQIAGLQAPHHPSFNFLRTCHFRPNSSVELETEFSDYPIYLGRSAKSKSPGRLGFSRHMKTIWFVTVTFTANGQRQISHNRKRASRNSQEQFLYTELM